MTALTLRIGFEIELIAPEGADRRTLADRIALDRGGRVERVFHTDSEPSSVPGMGHFWHLTPGFDVVDEVGAPLALFVDDVTLVADVRLSGSRTLDEHWYRVLSDDARILGLVQRQTSPDTPFDEVLDTVGALFGTRAETLGAVRRLRNAGGASIAMATGLSPGRERPCEIVTPPLTAEHEEALEALLGPARELGFTVPVEAAVHLHVDGAPFRSTWAFANLVRLFGLWREPLRMLLRTNPACTRLQALPLHLVDAVAHLGGGDETAAWPALQAAAAATGITKYFDVNLTSLLIDAPTRDTVEIRILPGSIHGDEIVENARLVEGLLDRCLDRSPFPEPPSDLEEATRVLRGLAGG